MVATREQVLEWLAEVKDPEVPVVSVVELGVVRDVRVTPDLVTVDITPTYSGCPAMKVMEEEIIATLAAHGVSRVEVHTIFDEAWTTEWMSEVAREKLRAYGIAPPRHLREGDDTLVPLRRKLVIACPFCGAHETTLRSEFGSTACKAIHTCRACGNPFDEFKAL